MQRILIIILTIVLWSVNSTAQSFILQGKVLDEQMNPLEFATISVASQGKVTMTGLQGEYSLELHSEDSVVVKYSLIGFRPKTRILRNPKGRQQLQITLIEDNTLQEVQVTERKRQTTQTQEIDTKKLKDVPSVTGNAVEELIQTQAGVSSHNEMSSQYNVRGGSFDENSVYINGVEVFRPFLVRSGQQEGLSVINPDMVEKIGFSTGGFEAKYGDKMASALDITYKRPKHFESTISASLLGASAYVGLAGKNFSWTNGLRYKTNRYLLGTLQTNGEYRPSQVDYQTYLSYQPSERWSIDLIGNISDNHYDFVPHDRETSFGTQEDVKAFRVYFDGVERDLFRTYFASLGITRHITKNTSLQLLASAFQTSERETYDIQGQYWLTQTETSENLGVGTYFQHARNYLKATVKNIKLTFRHKIEGHSLEAAALIRHENISERNTEYEMRDSAGYCMPHTGTDLNMIYSLRAVNKLSANRVESYIQDTWRFGKEEGTRYTLNYGLRLAHWSFNGETIASPRASLAIIPALNDNITMRFATGLYYQSPFFKELRDTTTINGVTYASLNKKARSQRSIHFIAGFDYRFKVADRPFMFTAEAYYKALGNLVPYSVNNMQVTYYGDQLCKGHIAGIDMKVFGEFVPGTDSWITFSIMNTAMNLNGIKLPLPTDQRYGVNLFFSDYFPGTTRWKMSLKLAFADGLPFSAPHRELESLPFRAPAYKRVDLGMSYRVIDGEKRNNKHIKNMWLSLDGLNLLGINNVNSYYWITDVTNHQYAVPNFLTGRQVNLRLAVEF